MSDSNDRRVVMRDINNGDKINIGVIAKLVCKNPVKGSFHDPKNRGAMIYEASFVVSEGPMYGQMFKILTSESDRVDRIFVDPMNMSWLEFLTLKWNEFKRTYLPRIPIIRFRRRRKKGNRK